LLLAIRYDARQSIFPINNHPSDTKTKHDQQQCDKQLAHYGVTAVTTPVELTFAPEIDVATLVPRVFTLSAMPPLTNNDDPTNTTVNANATAMELIGYSPSSVITALLPSLLLSN
jgi:2-phospho-L-lactate transferase/gluconeogenesis factor (CofD/UPF0052 family)